MRSYFVSCPARWIGVVKAARSDGDVLHCPCLASRWIRTRPEEDGFDLPGHDQQLSERRCEDARGGRRRICPAIDSQRRRACGFEVEIKGRLQELLGAPFLTRSVDGKVGSERALPLFPTRRKSAIFPPIVRLKSQNIVEGRIKSGGKRRDRYPATILAHWIHTGEVQGSIPCASTR